MPADQSWIRVRALSALLATTLAACGGGDDSPSPPPPGPPPPPASVQIVGKAVDGPLQGASACYDTNDNGACDSGEPASAAASDADGNFTIDVAPADAGKHRVIVIVPATAIDKDTGVAVGTAFTLVAPASGSAGAQSVFVSPLTTLVQQQMDLTGQTLAQARDLVQAQAALAVSPLADFTIGGNADNAKAANAAKLVLQASRQQAAAVGSVVGQADVSGGSITQADLDKAVLAKLIEALPSIGSAAADPALAPLTGTAREQALAASATQIVAQIGFTPDEAKFEIGLPKLPPLAQAATPEAGANLVALQYTNGANWFMRANISSAADNTPDANGLVRFFDVRTRMAPYAYDPDRGVAESFTRTTNSELFWSGSAWTACKLGDRFTSTVRDAQGRQSYNYCDNNELGTGQRTEIDIAGQTLASVWTGKLLPDAAKTSSPGNWSLSDVALLGTATFPEGSRLQYNSTTTTQTAITYNTTDGNRVTVFSDAVAQGGDARNGGSPACKTSGAEVPTTSLEEMVARRPGKPCVYDQATDQFGTSLNPNEIWGLTTVSLGDVTNGVERPAGTGTYYNTTARLRVSFTGTGGGTVYWRCYGATSNNSPRNCTKTGAGTYAIATLGDARVMTFNNLPTEVLSRSSTRVFVERAGAVYFGFKNKVGATTTGVRFNMAAANAVLAQLGLPGIVPADAPQALTGAKAANAAKMKGVWYFSDDFGTGILRVGENGEYLSAITEANTATRKPGYEIGWLDVDAAGKMGRLVALDTDGDSGFSHFESSATASVTDTTFSFTTGGVTEGFDGRLPDSGTGIVGMWAAESATNLRTTQFVFFANGKLLSIHPAETEGACATARLGPPGIEWSDYTFNATTGALRVFNKLIDTSGCTGAFDSADAVPNSEGNFVLTIAADGKTATAPVDDGTATLTLYRIAPK